MKTPFRILFAIVPCLAFGAPGHADVLYDNPVADDLFNCSFNTTCAASFFIGNDYAAQMFSLSSVSTITGASFTEVDTPGSTPTSASWIFLASDGAGGTPGTVLGSGLSPILMQTPLGPDLSAFGIINQYGFDVTPLTVAAVSYFLAVQAVTDNFGNYLFQGAAASGAFETVDSGATWTESYEGLPSVAVSVSGRIPEPASMLVLGTGLAGLGVTRRRRRSAVD